jgi:3-hydroxyisobutyrate dehydrogenase
MGLPMAGHLARAGHHVTVYNRTHTKAERWVDEFGGNWAATPRAAVADAQIVFTCVGDDAHLRGVVLGPDGAFAGMARDAVLCDHTTASAAIARELAKEAANRHLHFIDAPVSGGQSGAINGMLTVMCGGEPHAFARAQPVMAAFARAVTLIGPHGSGQLAKMVNQITIAVCCRAWPKASTSARPRAST